MLAKFGTNSGGGQMAKCQMVIFGTNAMQVAFYLAGEITQVKESIPWVRCASCMVFPNMQQNLSDS